MSRWQSLPSQAVLALVCVASATAQPQPTLRTFSASGTVRGEDGTEMQIVGGQVLGGVPMMWISAKDVKVKQVEIDPSTFKLAQSFAEGNTSTAVVNTADGTEIVFKEAKFLFPEPKSVAGDRKEMQLPMFALLSPFLGATWKGDAIAGGVIADRSIQVSSVWPDTVRVQYPTSADEHLYRVSRFFASTRSGELSPRTTVTFEQLTPREPVSFDIFGTQYRMQRIVFAQGPAGLDSAQRAAQLEKVEVAPELAKRMGWSLQATDDSKTIRYLSELRLGSVAERCAVYEGGVVLPYSAASDLRDSLDQQGKPALRVVYSFPTTAPSTSAPGQDTPGGMESRVSSFKGLGNGTVVDATTGLMWQRVDSETTMTYSDALAYATALSTAGHKDWRLPTKFELHSLYNNLSWKDDDHRNPVFGWGEGDWYWSGRRASENQEIGSAGSMPVTVAGGSIDCKSFKNEYSAWAHPDGKNLVRCVRGRVSKAYISNWSKRLSDTDPAKRWKALLTLSFIEGPEAKEALPEIRKLITDPEDHIRVKAAEIAEAIEKE